MFFKPAFWMHVLVSMLKKFHFQLSKHTTGLYHATPVRDVIYSENGTVIVVYRVILKGTDGEVSFLTFSLWKYLFVLHKSSFIVVVSYCLDYVCTKLLYLHGHYVFFSNLLLN